MFEVGRGTYQDVPGKPFSLLKIPGDVIQKGAQLPEEPYDVSKDPPVESPTLAGAIVPIPPRSPSTFDPGPVSAGAGTTDDRAEGERPPQPSPNLP